LLEKDRIFDDTDNSDSSSGSELEAETDDDTPSATKFTAYELQRRFKNISDVIDKLIKLAEAIRASGVRSRAARAARYEHIEGNVNYTAEFESSFLPLVLKHRFKLEEPLLGRFVNAISLRRRRFLYQSKHQKRLAYGHDVQFSPFKTIESGPQLQLATTAPKSTPETLKAMPPARNETVTDNKTEAPTQATTFRLEQKLKVPSRIISASTKFEASEVNLPPPLPLPSARATHFECPYCCILVPVSKRESRLWKQHLIADLQPFLCVEPDCSTPDVVLENKNEWLEHQRWQHAMEWWCEGDDTKHAALKFSSEKEFIEHLKQSHQTNLSVNALRSKVEMAGHPSLSPFTCCSFCDYLPERFACLELDRGDAVFHSVLLQKKLQEHLMHELLTIFLVALPDREDFQDEIVDTDTERSMGTRSTARQILIDDDNNDHSPAGISQEGVAYPRSMETRVDVIDKLWMAVWSSPKLRESVRGSYLGMEQDEALQYIAMKQSVAKLSQQQLNTGTAPDIPPVLLEKSDDLLNAEFS